MQVLFDILKGVFFFLTIVIGIFFVRGEIIFGPENFYIVKQIMMPGYLVFCGVMVGYLIANIWSNTTEDLDLQHNIYIKSFIMGIVIGLILSMIYIFV